VEVTSGVVVVAGRVVAAVVVPLVIVGGVVGEAVLVDDCTALEMAVVEEIDVVARVGDAGRVVVVGAADVEDGIPLS
jgi:hypothetical protein